MRAYIMPHPPIAVPEVGKEEIEKIEATGAAFKKASEDIADYDPETIVIISPHAPLLADAFFISKGHKCEGNLERFGAPDPSVKYTYDRELSDEIVRLCEVADIPVWYSEEDSTKLDHGTVVPLYFVNREYGFRIKEAPYRIVRISPSFLPDDVLFDMGRIIERAIAHTGRRAVIIASGDLSHKLKKDGPYGFIKEGPEFDKAVTDVMKSGILTDFAKIDKRVNELSANCGYHGFVMLAGALSGYKITPNFLSYEGTFGVGYGICIFECDDWYVKLAKQSLESYITKGRTLSAADTSEYPDMLRRERAGVFVCIKKRGELRGCIGTILPTRENSLEETVALAVSAGTQDPRFPAVTEDELASLDYTVDVMGTPEKASKDMLDVKRYGVIVSCGTRRGLLLPDLEGVDTVEEQLSISCRKGGISPYENYSIERFTVERHV
ncbi:MAG: AmmeMemoRadiSam system protein A [Lachnospiraceae bacterium]|nr:AmmeMemoRadiSam system protein A [Lachnospiraceae bacterium]